MTECRAAMFTQDGNQYIPANKHATAVCAILSRMKLTNRDMIRVRQEGYTPMLTNGQPIGGVDMRA